MFVLFIYYFFFSSNNIYSISSNFLEMSSWSSINLLLFVGFFVDDENLSLFMFKFILFWLVFDVENYLRSFYSSYFYFLSTFFILFWLLLLFILLLIMRSFSFSFSFYFYFYLWKVDEKESPNLYKLFLI